MAGWMAEPLGSKERINLGQALRAAQPEMGVDDLEVLAADLDRRPEGAARFQERPVWQSRQSAGLDKLRRSGGQEGIAILLLHDP